VVFHVRILEPSYRAIGGGEKYGSEQILVKEMLFDLSPPSFKTPLAIGNELFVVSKVELKAFFCWCVEFTPIILVVSANLWSLGIDSATTVSLQVFALT
jgi:hypothetical protein